MDERDERREPASIDARGIKPPAAYSIAAARRPTGVSVVVAARRAGPRGGAAAARAGRRGGERGRALVVDLAETTFIDSAVLKELLRARAELAASDVRLILAAVPPPVRRLLDLTRTSELFEDAPDVEAAVRRLSGDG